MVAGASMPRTQSYLSVLNLIASNLDKGGADLKISKTIADSIDTMHLLHHMP